MLFNVYINDFPGALKDIAHTVLCVDDTSSLVRSKDLSSLNNKLNCIMAVVSSWFQNNSLVLNLRRTHLIKFMTLGSPEYALSAMHNGLRLGAIYSVNFLCLYIGYQLIWQQHN
jgi:hypothetical protein